ncbi:unnamed protein product, partial [marine sediment metagenome]
WKRRRGSATDHYFRGGSWTKVVITECGTVAYKHEITDVLANNRCRYCEINKEFKDLVKPLIERS